MQATDTPYNLVHIISAKEYKTPLLATQVFDRAQSQAVVDGPGKPLSVSIWIVGPMRVVLQKDIRALTVTYRKRCPNVSIRLVGGINRLKEQPAGFILKTLRRSLKVRTVYHCRGESSSYWAYMLKKAFPGDAVVSDIRGYWPLERLANHKIYAEADMTPAQQEVYRADITALKKLISISDVITTVSEPLRAYLQKHVDSGEDTTVIPCCVKSAIPDTNRNRIRKELGIEDKTAILYLGSTQKWQRLEDLVIPFMRSALAISDKTVAVFITQNKDEMMALLDEFEIDRNRAHVISLPQGEVADYITAMDMGLLMMPPTPLSTFSQPVKFGEYLSGGIPVILEEGTGATAGILTKYNIGFVVKLWGKETRSDFDNEVGKAITWFEKNRDVVRTNARKFVEQHYTWQANAANERDMYLRALEKSRKS